MTEPAATASHESHHHRRPVPPAQRWRAVCAYDGGRWHGWQSQTNAVAVQDVIEKALAKILRAEVRIHGSGRTDTGVHALAQVFHFDAVWPHGADRLLTALTTVLPEGAQLKSLRLARPDFHARYDATGKRYSYRIFLGRADPFEAPWCWSLPMPLDLAAMQSAARRLQGKHDFAAYCAWGYEERETTVRDLRRLEVRRRGPRLRVVLEADGFLYKMARSIVGTLVNVGLGRISADAAVALLHSKTRVPEVKTAPANGLFLERVFYG
jgi:tRNA pseudouridine38-40 synthase